MQKELHILILEDIPEEANLVERTIRREKINFVSKRVDSREAFSEALKSFRPDIVLSDHALPQFNSIEALKLSRKINPMLPFILVTGTVSEEFAVTCLKQGADDYVLKSNLTRLPAAIRNALNHRETEAMKQRAEAEIRNQNEQLLFTNAALKKTNTELDNFVYSVSHNLRGPISSILGLVNLAKMEEANAVVTNGRYYDMIQTSIRTLDRTITEIIHYSQNSRIELQPEPVDLRRLLMESFNKLSYLPVASAISLEIDIVDDLFVTDRFRLGVVLNNLLSNSIKYCDPSKEKMYIRIEQRRDNGWLAVNVIDNGVGIREDIMPHIYNMFYRGNERSEGAGLGLYIVREAVEKMGGKIAIESIENEGTTVSVHLPELGQIHGSEVARKMRA